MEVDLSKQNCVQAKIGEEK